MKVDDITKSQLSINVGAPIAYHTPEEETTLFTSFCRRCCLLEPGEEDFRLEKQVWDLLGKEFLGPVCLWYVLRRCSVVGTSIGPTVFLPCGEG